MGSVLLATATKYSSRKATASPTWNGKYPTLRPPSSAWARSPNSSLRRPFSFCRIAASSTSTTGCRVHARRAGRLGRHHHLSCPDPHLRHPQFHFVSRLREDGTRSDDSEKLVAWFRDKPLEFQPGEGWSYSNSGYALLGYLIEKISGRRMRSSSRPISLPPLHMNDSGYDSNFAIIPQRAAGYSSGRNGMVGIMNTGYIHMSVPFSAGALYSTTEDLLRWEQGLFGGKLLSAASLQKMTTPFKHDYACGLFARKVDGHNVIEHDGAIEGFNTSMSYYPDDKLTIIVLANLNGPAATQMTRKLASAMQRRFPLPVGQTIVLCGLPGCAAAV